MLSSDEFDIIASKIEKNFDEVSSKYSFTKYPAGNYKQFKSTFSSKSILNNEIEPALLWKWGHTGKSNYPLIHKNLILEISSLWEVYIKNTNNTKPKDTFEFWKQALRKNTRYITVAYITHLIHHNEGFPIIDQHNFRAMNSFIKDIRSNFIAKKKPSNWQDILDLKLFIEGISVRLGYDKESIDRYLMMYGRHYAKR